MNAKETTHLRRLLHLAVAAPLFALAFTACVGIGGETISLQYDRLDLPSEKFGENVALEGSAHDLRSNRSREGRATITLFAITSGTVRTRGTLADEIVSPIKDVLESMGYDVDLVDSHEKIEDGSPVMQVSINEFYFRNYNWLWPIVPTWGGIELAVSLEAPDGRVMFDKTLRGGGTSFCLTGNCAFNAASRRALTDVMNQLVEACSSQSFRTALAPIPHPESEIAAPPPEAQPASDVAAPPPDDP